MSLLTIVQSACNRIGILSPTQVVGNTDQQIIQMLALCNEEGEELANRVNWTALQTNATFTTLATESQGAIATIAPGLNRIVNDTIYNRNLRRPVFGPLSEQEFAEAKAMNINGPWNRFLIQGGILKFNPPPVAGQTCAFDYITSYWCTDATGVTGRSAWSLDSDIAKLNENIIALGLIWRFKAAKGLDYAEDYNKYERRVIDGFARDGGKPTLSMNGGPSSYMPNIAIPAGSWSLP
jgi:hypothetical protein